MLVNKVHKLKVVVYTNKHIRQNLDLHIYVIKHFVMLRYQISAHH